MTAATTNQGPERLDRSTTNERWTINGGCFNCVWCVLLRFVEEDSGCWFVEETAAGEVVCGAVEAEGEREALRATRKREEEKRAAPPRWCCPAASMAEKKKEELPLRFSATEVEREGSRELGFSARDGY